jgi:hypothetical protein
MAKNKKKGTGEILGEIDFGEGMEWVVEDDGDNDCWVKVEFFFEGTQVGNAKFHSQMRQRSGDEKFMELLDEVEGDTYQPIV